MAGQVQHSEKTLIKTREPKMFAVVLHNDEITTMDFVVELLVKIFHKTAADGAAIMMEVHSGGLGVAGVYTYDVAVTKKRQADQLSRERNFPLKLTLDEC
ncbi:MAG: ATP-dependent Clp protease adaptor ClpS [Clostridiales bacterium]|jgi:ATP-dependent Clp protease adaptor protein ClpS|nr:ATP-dependent Clp protease adaptor ClpS [Clostridiales bacterium]